MRLSYLLLSIPLTLLVACSSAPVAVVQEIKAKPIIQEAFSRILDSNFRGQLYFKGNKTYFTRCVTGQTFLVHAERSLNRIYSQLSAEQKEPVYIEFTGELVFPDPRDQDADVIMRIDRIHHMAVEKASLQCARPISEFPVKAKGESPYWRLNIDGQNLYFATKARNQVYQINKANFQTTQMNKIKSLNKLDEPLELMIEPSECYNQKDNEYWGYSAEVTSIWGTLKGCGETGWPVLEDKFTGYYLSKTPVAISNLALNPDNSVEYSKKTLQGTQVKTGFWKNNTPDRVVVMLTQEAGQPLREELIFTRSGLTLTTQKINENNIINTLEAPLVFKKMNIKDGVEETAEAHRSRSFTPMQIDPATEVDRDIQKAVYQYFKIHRTDPQNSRFSAVKFDLNGDGIDEAIVLLDWCSKNGCEMLIFEGRDHGYRFSSRISQVQVPISVAKSQHFLWQSLLVDKDGLSLILDFDGLSYPIHASTEQAVNKQYEASKVVLFSRGKPQKWFTIEDE